MNNLLSLPFYIASIIQIGLVVTALGLFKFQGSGFEKLSEQRRYWLLALQLSVVAYLFFIIGIEHPYDAFDTNIFLYFGNLALVASAIFQTLFCLALTGRLSKRWNMSLIGLLLIFAIVFYIYRLSGNFVERSLIVGLFLSICFATQLKELFLYRTQDGSQILRLLAMVSLVELVMTILRMSAILSANSIAVISLKELPNFIAMITSLQLGLNVLSYIVSSGYWVERVSAHNARIAKENKAIVELLEDKNNLIYSLISTRKIAESGALAATIAHEINQPLAALQLNAQYLKALIQKKLDDSTVNELITYIVDDNKRAAEIVKTLRVPSLNQLIVS